MPRRTNLRLDHSGIADVLKSGIVRAEVMALAEATAAAARGRSEVARHDVPVDVTGYTTDRAAASVTLVHVLGNPLQAKYGTLTASAGSVGLEVHGGGSHA